MAVSTYSAPANDRSIASINITPLVDVMLVLLVIFMISAPALTQTLSMRLPAEGPPARIERPRLTLQVNSSGEFALEGRRLGRAALQAALADIASRAPEAVLEIDASKDADYQAFATALSAARGSGLANITFTR